MIEHMEENTQRQAIEEHKEQAKTPGYTVHVNTYFKLNLYFSRVRLLIL